MSQSQRSAEERALVVFDALCAMRLEAFVDAELVGELCDGISAPGRAADLISRVWAPARKRAIDRVANGPPSTLSDAVPPVVLQMVIAMLPSIPPPPRDAIERLIGSPAVRAEVRRLLQETFEELLRPSSGRGGLIGWGARAAANASRGVVGAIGGALGADLEKRIGDAVELGVGLAQKRIVDLVSSPETARRVGGEVARILPRLLQAPEPVVARSIAKLPHAVLDGLSAALWSHNAARPSVRQNIVDEAQASIAELSQHTIGELLDRFGARDPLRRFVARRGAHVVNVVVAHLDKHG